MGKVFIKKMWNLGQKTAGDTLEAWPGCGRFRATLDETDMEKKFSKILGESMYSIPDGGKLNSLIIELSSYEDPRE